LIQLLQKDVQFEYDEDYQHAFRTLKQALISAPKYSASMPLESRLDKIAKMSSLTIVAFGNQKL